MREYFVWLAKLITIVVLILILPGILIGIVASSKNFPASSDIVKGKKNLVAVVSLSGTIEDARDVIDELHKQAEDEAVEGIVLRVDSAGGAVSPSQEIYNTVNKLKERKPIIASLGMVAASGGLYAAASASKIFAQPGTMTGSIGVLMQIPNFSKVMNTVGVDVVTIKSGALKDTGNSFRDMTPEEKAFLEETAQVVHNQFITDIAKARGINVEVLRSFADGRVLLGEQALKLNIIDGYGDVYQAARAVFDVKGKPLGLDEHPSVFYTDDQFKEFKRYLSTFSNIAQLFQTKLSLRYEMR